MVVLKGSTSCTLHLTNHGLPKRLRFNFLSSLALVVKPSGGRKILSGYVTFGWRESYAHLQNCTKLAGFRLLFTERVG